MMIMQILSRKDQLQGFHLSFFTSTRKKGDNVVYSKSRKPIRVSVRSKGVSTNIPMD